jgi:lactonase family protein with 7-bladed beta-propeller/NHL repeat-containing protein
MIHTAALPRPYCLASSAMLPLLALSLCIPSPAEPQSPVRFEYAAKTICGLPRNVPNFELPLQPYATVLNVHNPTAAVVVLVKRLALGFPPGLERPGTVAPVALDTLPPGAALAIDCFDLRRRVSSLPAFFEGFVVIQSTGTLDVVGVYAVPGGVDVQQVRERPIPLGVAKPLYVSDSTHVAVYAPGATGNATPLRVITGPNTGFRGPAGIALDATGQLYVANQGNAITLYPPGATGNAPPAATLAGSSTGLNGPADIALGPAGQLYVTNALGNSITTYAPGATGNAAPTNTIAGSNTGLNGPQGIALDAVGRLYVANQFGNSITVYAPGATGNATPGATITGANTGLSGPEGIAFDAAGRLYVANRANNSITIYAPGATGNASPVAALTGAATGLSAPTGIALDPLGQLAVANFANLTVTVYAAGASGNATPAATINVASALLFSPVWVAF